MGKEKWNALVAKLKKEGQATPQLHPDHFYPTSRIAKSAAMTRWMKVYAKASPAKQEEMRKALQRIGDLPRNLFSMRGDANVKWKKDKMWSELDPAGSAEYGYKAEDVKAMRDLEAEVVQIVEKEISDQADQYQH
jgi:hypothetical protein